MFLLHYYALVFNILLLVALVCLLRTVWNFWQSHQYTSSDTARHTIDTPPDAPHLQQLDSQKNIQEKIRKRRQCHACNGTGEEKSIIHSESIEKPFVILAGLKCHSCKGTGIRAWWDMKT